MVIGPPLTGARWVVAGGVASRPPITEPRPCRSTGSSMPPSDSPSISSNPAPTTPCSPGGVGPLHNYEYFGSKVPSVAAGVVVGMQDGQSEQTPPEVPEKQHPSHLLGNYLVIKIGHRRSPPTPTPPA